MKLPKITLSFVAMICILAWLDWHICLSFLISAFVHELGHLLSMKLWKIPIGNMSIGADGVRIGTGMMGGCAELSCAASGPLAGVIFALIVLRKLPQTAVVSLFLSGVNLLPLYPLDGGRMLQSVLSMCMEEAKVRKTVRVITSVTCCALMICACWATACLQMGLWPIFAALILLCRAAARE